MKRKVKGFIRKRKWWKALWNIIERDEKIQRRPIKHLVLLKMREEKNHFEK